VYVPATAGIVREIVPDRSETRFVLDDGRVVSVASTTQYLGGTSPQLAELLLAGSEPERWIYRARPIGSLPNDPAPMCYELVGEARGTTTHVFKAVHDAARGDVVMAFRKTADWTDPGYLQGSDVLLGNVTCINSKGEAFEQRFGR